MNTIEWGDLKLQEVNINDIPLLYEWRNTSSFLNFLTARAKCNSLDEFRVELKQDFLTDRQLQFIIYYRSQPIGTTYSYSYNKIDKYSFISIFIIDKYHQTGIGIKAVVVFSKFLFENYNLFKIYFDIYNTNLKIISALKKRKISLEGRFLKQHLHKEDRHDVLRFAIYSQDISLWFNSRKLTN